MKTINSKLKALISDQRGAGMVEYVILAGVIGILALGAFKEFGENVQSKVQDHAGVVSSDIPSATE